MWIRKIFEWVVLLFCGNTYRKDWRYKTCESCNFRMGDCCHYGPPAMVAYGGEVAWPVYPKANFNNVNGFLVYVSSCSKWKERK